MKNLFKKSSKKETAIAIQELSKSQLEKVVGGLDTTTSNTTTEIYSENNKTINDSTKSSLSIIR